MLFTELEDSHDRVELFSWLACSVIALVAGSWHRPSSSWLAVHTAKTIQSGKQRINYEGRKSSHTKTCFMYILCSERVSLQAGPSGPGWSVVSSLHVEVIRVGREVRPLPRKATRDRALRGFYLEVYAYMGATSLVQMSGLVLTWKRGQIPLL